MSSAQARLGKRKLIADAFRSKKRANVRKFVNRGAGPIGRSARDRPKYSIVSQRPVVSRTLSQPWCMIQHLMYNQAFALSNYGSGTGYYDRVFAHNSIAQCDTTGTGPTAFGQVEWSALYNRYEVYASKITVRIDNQDDEIIRLAIIPSGIVTSRTEWDRCITEPLAKFTQVSSAGNPRSSQVLSHFVSTNKMIGTMSSGGDLEDNSALFSSNPTRRTYWHVFIQKDSAALFSGQMTVTIVYYCRFKEPKRLSDQQL